MQPDRGATLTASCHAKGCGATRPLEMYTKVVERKRDVGARASPRKQKTPPGRGFREAAGQGLEP